MRGKNVFAITILTIISSVLLSIYISIIAWVPISFIVVCALINHRKEYCARIFKLNYKKESLYFLLLFLIVNAWFVYSRWFNIPSDFQLVTYAIYIINFFIQAFDEECLFRGYFFHELKGNLFLRTFVNSLIFTFAHYLSLLDSINMIVLIQGVIIRFLISVVLCICYEKNKSILEVTIFHFAFNVLLLIEANFLTNVYYRVEIVVSLELAVYCLYLYRCDITHFFKKIKSLM